MKAIAEALDLTETAAVHRGLVELAQRYVPQYPRDNGPVAEDQHRAIAEAVRSKHGEPVITEMLFGAPSQPARKVKSGGSKRVPASRAR